MNIKQLLPALLIGSLFGCSPTSLPSTDWSKEPLADVQQAAEMGDTKAQLQLEMRYSLEQGVPQDLKKSFFWLRKAAEQGDLQAQSSLGQAYLYGIGTQQDFKSAVSWFRKVAETGDAEGQYYLGWMYESGRGVPRDFKQAYAWLASSAAKRPDTVTGNVAAKMRDEIADKLSSAELVKAQELATYYFEKF